MANVIILPAVGEVKYFSLYVNYFVWAGVNTIIVIIELFVKEDLPSILIVLSLALVQLVSASYFLKKDYDIPLGKQNEYTEIQEMTEN